MKFAIGLGCLAIAALSMALGCECNNIMLVVNSMIWCVAAGIWMNRSDA